MKLSLDQIRDRIYSKIIPQPEPVEIPDIYIVDIYLDYAIISRDGKYFKLPFSVEKDELKFGDEIEVEKEYVPVEKAEAARKAHQDRIAAALQPAHITTSAQLKAASGDPKSEDYGYQWDVRIVEFGPDIQDEIFWDPIVLKAAKSLYEGSKVFALTEAQHQAQSHPFGKSVRDLVGWINNVSDDEKGLGGNFNILKSAKWLRDMAVDAFERGKPDLIGLSNDIGGKVTTRVVNGKRMRTPVEISDVTVDVVYAPAAGGKFIRMAAAEQADRKKEAEMLEKLLAALRQQRPDLYEKIKAKVEDKTITEDDVMNVLQGAMKKPDPSGPEDPQGRRPTPTGDDDPKKILEQTRIVACSLILKDELKGSGLPELVQARIRKQYEGKIFADEDLVASIKGWKEDLDKLSGSGGVIGSGRVEIAQDEFDKSKKMLEDFWDPTKKVHSFKACYIAITGDKLVSGRLENAPRLKASLATTDWAQIFGDSVTRRMLAEYAAAGLSDWRKIVNVAPISDFRTQRRMRMGGYGNLPTVAQGGPYTALTSPGDEEATYAATKKGGTEDITREMIKNDDVGSIRMIPLRLGRSAARTIYEFVFDFLKDNPLIYDSQYLFHADHANLGANALDTTYLQASRRRIIKQTELTSLKRLGLVPKFGIVPVDLDKTLYDLITPPSMATGVIIAGVDYQKTWQMEEIVVIYWTDTNNWYLSADPRDCPSIEIGFIDGNEEPELFVQDMPNVGSMFSNDKLTYKIRHEYGGAVCDFRGLDGNIVG